MATTQEVWDHHVTGFVEKNVYIVWDAESDSVVYEFATDTFTIEAGKITLQTIGYVKRNKSKG